MTEHEMRELLDKPYPDDPTWTPWTRFLGPAARHAYNLGTKIRQKLKDVDW